MTTVKVLMTALLSACAIAPEVRPDSGVQAAPVPGDAAFVQAMLDAHQAYRGPLGLTALVWSASLATEARTWAETLASQGTFEHSGGGGENLWKGTAGAFPLRQRVDAWGNERRYFTPGVFPQVSTTGKWSDVGHYTQMVWRQTTSLGCGVATGQGSDVLVCRYAPPGNVIGQRVY